MRQGTCPRRATARAALGLLATVTPATIVLCGDYIPLDPSRAHVEILTEHWDPDLRFYRTRSLEGDPVLYLDGKGLHLKGELVCSWPDQAYDPDLSYNTVLDADVDPAGGCRGLPIISTWGDQGRGVATLLVEIVARKDELVTVECRGEEYYMDLGTLPENKYRVLESRDHENLRDQREIQRILLDPSYVSFLKEVRSCLAGPAPETCLPAHAAPEAMPPAFRERIATREVFYRSSGRDVTYRDVLVSCFAEGTLLAIDGGPCLVGEDYLRCDLVKVGDRWYIEGLSEPGC